MSGKTWVFGVLAVVLLFGVRQVGAAVLTFTDEGTFLGTAGPQSLESFETLTVGVRTTDPIATPQFVVSLEPLPGSTGDMYIGEGTHSNGVHPTDGEQYLVAGDQSPTPENAFRLFFDFPVPVESFGLTVIDYGDQFSSGHLSFINDVGDSFTIAEGFGSPINNGRELFFGIINTDQAFSQVIIEKTTIYDGIAVDEVYYHSDVIAEPSSSLAWGGLLGMGLIGAWWRRRRKQ